MTPPHSTIYRIALGMLIIPLSACNEPNTTITTQSSFTYEQIDAEGPRRAWGKTVGDIDGDGMLDLLVAGHKVRELTVIERIKRKLGFFQWDYEGGELVWYKNPSWERSIISEEFSFRTDMEVADIDNDGANDVLVIADEGMFWYKNPSWERHSISQDQLHDVEIADLDNDGDIDIVARNQSAFSSNDGNTLLIFRQDYNGKWQRSSQLIPHGEGLKLAHMDNDSYIDIVVNERWLKNPKSLTTPKAWLSTNYATEWSWSDVFIDTEDMNDDGLEDIVLAPSEKEGEYYQIAWFEAPSNPETPWKMHVVAPNVEAVHHFIAAHDVDRDGHTDIMTSEMSQGEGDNEVSVYFNKGANNWLRQTISTTPSHSMRAMDIDNDFDIDLFGANWYLGENEGDYPVELWRNNSSEKDSKSWRRHVIDERRPGQAIFIFAENVDGDNAKDIITGGFWYKNPLNLSEHWDRKPLGEKAKNVVIVSDFDGDQDIDILASNWPGSYTKPNLADRLMNRLGVREYDYNPQGNRFVWGKNNGQGEFHYFDNIDAASGDFLQGSALYKNQNGAPDKVVLSWHRAGEGIQALSIPQKPDTQQWAWSLLSETSQDEALSVGDINNDGVDDILLGTKWLEGDALKVNILSDTHEEPDRNLLADLNGDGLQDAIVGFQAISKNGRLVWYQQPKLNKHLQWEEHLIAEVIGPMSLDVTDLDQDGDLDVIVGEHNLKSPEQARLIWFENTKGDATRWKGHLIYRGDEHHDGAQAVDLDNDGDLDIISIGFGHNKVVVYENRLDEKEQKR